MRLPTIEGIEDVDMDVSEFNRIVNAFIVRDARILKKKHLQQKKPRLGNILLGPCSPK
jgi:hypothetical protein